jgi:hypothetical protein
MADTKNPIIVTTCQAGAPTPRGSSIGQMASQNGVEPSQLYACTGNTSYRDNDPSPTCDGHWVDGNGQPVPDDQRAKYELHNCTFVRDPRTGHHVDDRCAD